MGYFSIIRIITLIHWDIKIVCLFLLITGIITIMIGILFITSIITIITIMIGILFISSIITIITIMIGILLITSIITIIIC